MRAAAARHGLDQADFTLAQWVCRWINQLNPRFEGLQSIAYGPLLGSLLKNRYFFWWPTLKIRTYPVRSRMKHPPAARAIR